MRKFLMAGLALMLVTSVATAANVYGTVKAVDLDKKMITVSGGDGAKTFPFEADAEVERLTDRKKKTYEKVADGMKAVTTGTEVMLVVEKKDDKEVVTKVRIELVAKKKK